MNKQTENSTQDSSAPTSGSIHIVIQERCSISGFCFNKPYCAFTTRKQANAEAKLKNSKATECSYFVKTVKLKG